MTLDEVNRAVQMGKSLIRHVEAILQLIEIEQPYCNEDFSTQVALLNQMYTESIPLFTDEVMEAYTFSSFSPAIQSIPGKNSLRVAQNLAKQFLAEIHQVWGPAHELCRHRSNHTNVDNVAFDEILYAQTCKHFFSRNRRIRNDFPTLDNLRMFTAAIDQESSRVFDSMRKTAALSNGPRVETARTECSNQNLVGVWSSQNEDSETETLSEARHSQDFRYVSWFGTDYRFTANQAAIVSLLWEAWKNGTPELGHSFLLEEASVKSTAFKDVFKKCPALGQMIVPGSTKGTAQLNEPSERSQMQNISSSPEIPI